MHIVFVMMSRQVAHPEIDYGWNYERTEPPVNPWHNLGIWPSDTLLQLCRMGHTGHFISIDTPEFVKGHFGEDRLVHYEIAQGCQVTYLHDSVDISGILERADAIIVRHDYPAYQRFLGSIQWDDRFCIQILAGPRGEDIKWRPQCRRYRLLVNSSTEKWNFRDLGYPAEIFKKLASRNFYFQPDSPIPRKYDVMFACWSTLLKRKRFDLFLDALPLMIESHGTPLKVLMVGNVSAHKDRVEKLTRETPGLAIHVVGEVHRTEMPNYFRSSRLTVVSSSGDANPQVINESIVCDTPVACARDITGGSFQITSQTGELFDPNPRSLSATVLDMLRNLKKYKPAENGITLEHSAFQLESLMMAKSTRQSR